MSGCVGSRWSGHRRAVPLDLALQPDARGLDEHCTGRRGHRLQFREPVAVLAARVRARRRASASTLIPGRRPAQSGPGFGGCLHTERHQRRVQ